MYAKQLAKKIAIAAIALCAMQHGACSLGSDIDALRAKAAEANPPVITMQPSATTNCMVGSISGSLSVTARATKGAVLSYQWWRMTIKYPTFYTDTGGFLFEIISDATNASFAIPTNLTAGVYYYVCKVSATGRAYAVSSNVATVKVNIPPMTSSSGIEMIWVPAGSFELGRELGTAGSGNQSNYHTVTLSSGFYLGKYEVTQEQYQAVMGGNPSYFTSSPASGETQAKRPVETVSWYDAIVFCNKLSMKEGLTPAYRINNSTDPAAWGDVPTSSNTTWNNAAIVSGSTGYRLPTEAQWEYAAKGGAALDNTTYAGSNSPGTVAWYYDNSNSMTHEVGKKAPNGLGLYDMSGNVWEWCWDWYGSYTSGAKTDPMGASSGSYRVPRGGYCYFGASYLRSVYRYGHYPFDRSYFHGFRLLLP